MRGVRVKQQEGTTDMMVMDRTAPLIGIAGINTHPLSDAVMGIAGHMGTTLRPAVDSILSAAPRIKKLSKRTTLGDRAALAGWKNACFLLDYTYITCTDQKRGGMRWSNGFANYFDVTNRRLPLVFDSAAFREANGSAPNWSNYARYCEAIDMAKPDAVMSKDVLGDQLRSLAGYERMVADGYGPITIPVWHTRPTYNVKLSGAENGRIAAQDPILRQYVDRANLVALGGMVKGPCPLLQRAEYMGSLADQFPGTRFWGLGQASGVVVNGLGTRGLLDRISVDGSWWIHTARTEQIAVLDGGLLSNIILARTGVRSFLTFTELMALNLRSILSAYAGLWSFPGPSRVPTNMEDDDERHELVARVRQLDLFAEVL